eukprot:651985-Prymnesium_polylepis.2
MRKALVPFGKRCHRERRSHARCPSSWSAGRGTPRRGEAASQRASKSAPVVRIESKLSGSNEVETRTRELPELLDRVPVRDQRRGVPLQADHAQRGRQPGQFVAVLLRTVGRFAVATPTQFAKAHAHPRARPA